MKRVVSFIISISGINECSASTAGDLCRRKLHGLWLRATVLLLFYFPRVKSPLGGTERVEAMQSAQMQHLSNDSICGEPNTAHSI